VTDLYGLLDPLNRDWTDGLLSHIFRDVNKPTDKMERRCILFDGDVDALWIENMNSVMDDNKLLTLANGERIRMKNHCALFFEVQKDFKIIVQMLWSPFVIPNVAFVLLTHLIRCRQHCISLLELFLVFCCISMQMMGETTRLKIGHELSNPQFTSSSHLTL
jgi:hypothetical protein